MIISAEALLLCRFRDIMKGVMEMDTEMPKRKSTRLKSFDYSSTGAYFVTICVKDRKPILSEIVKTERKGTDEATDCRAGEELAPFGYSVKLTPLGEVAWEQLMLIQDRFPSVTIEDCVVMPDHIHAVIFLHGRTGGASPAPAERGDKCDPCEAGGASPSPTLSDVVCAFKSLTSRICKRRYGIEGMFQRSFAEHIVRDKEDYETRRRYIAENPMRWYCKYLNA